MFLELGPYCCLLFLSLMFLIVPAFTGRYFERKHLRELGEREKRLFGSMIIHNRRYPYSKGELQARMYSGEVVIAADRFKTWLARWRQLIGGKMGSLAPVVERARREALLRAAERAKSDGYTELGNIRYNTASLKWANPRARELLICVQVFGTAYSPKQN